MAKKGIGLVLSGCCLLVLLQCNLSKEKTHQNQNPLVMHMFNNESKPFDWNNNNPVARVLTAKTGVRFEMEYTEGNSEDTARLMLADRSYPDIIYTKGSQDEFIKAGAFIPLDNLIEQYGANIKKFYAENLKRLRYSLDDPSIYYLGSFPIKDEASDPQEGFRLQLAVLKELGYPRLRTLADFEAALRTYKERYPVIDGKPTIGLSLIADDWRFLISVTNYAVFATGAPNDGEWYIDPVTHEAILHHKRPVEREYFRWLNHMHNTGLLDPESFVQTYAQYLAKIASGRVLGLIDAKWDIANTESRLRQENKAERTYASLPLTLSEDYLFSEFYAACYSSRWGISITDHCEDPVAVIRFFDYLLSEEGQILVHWGVPRLHYQIDKEHKRFFTPEQLEKRNDPNAQTTEGVFMFSYPFPEYGEGILDSTGQPFMPAGKSIQAEKSFANEQELLAAYGVESWYQLYPAKGNFPVRPYGEAWQIEIPEQSEEKLIFKHCEEIIRKRITEAILSVPSKFDTIYDLMLKELEVAQVGKLERMFTQKIRDLIKLWND